MGALARCMAAVAVAAPVVVAAAFLVRPEILLRHRGRPGTKALMTGTCGTREHPRWRAY